MNVTAMRDLFVRMEDSTDIQWNDSEGNPLTRQSKGLSPEAWSDLTGSAYYFYIYENSQGAGYTIFEIDGKTLALRIVSTIGQFYDAAVAEEVCMAFARGRVDSQMCRNAFKTRKARSLDGVMMYKRNQARTGNIADWRADQKKRVIPKKPDEAMAFIVLYVEKALPRATGEQVTRALVDLFKEAAREQLAD
jgi:hypothetical protein